VTTIPTPGADVAVAPVRHLTLEELQAAHAAGGPSSTDAGTLELIVRRPSAGDREALAVGTLDERQGLVGDSWSRRPSRRSPDGGPHPQMQLALIERRVVDAMAAGDRSRWPLAGDQLVVDLDLSPENLPAGSRLGIGGAVIAVTAEPHTGCAKLAAHYGRDALRWVSTPQARARNLRGIYTEVVVGGTVAAGQPVTVLSRP
jgi:hypothetical protein